MQSTDPVITLKGTILRKTEKAVQFSIHDISGDPQTPIHITWFPFSQVKSTKTSSNVGEDILIVSEWIMSQKELI